MAKKVAINGVIGWDATPEQLDADLCQCNGEDVEVHISSPGGLVGAGLRMYNLLRNYPGKTTAVLSGYAMSMASYIPQACNEIKAEDNAVYMIHNARGGVWGDHNEVQKYGKYLQGLSGISAREFAKQTARRGKAQSLADVVAMMDAETFMFGEEMVDNGFVDSIITTEGEEADKETAMMTAQASFNEAQARMASDPGKVRADLQLAMQMFDLSSLSLPATPARAQQISPPAATAAGTKKKEEQQMNLQELLAANPAAKAEYDAAITTATANGVTTGKEAMQATVKAVAPFLANASYPKQVGEMAVKVLTGEQTAANLTALVATADMMKEMQASSGGAQGTQEGGDVAAQQAAALAASKAGMISDETALQAEITALKEVA